jgi:hypothetical protein
MPRRQEPPKEPRLRDALLRSQKSERFRDLLLYCAIGVFVALCAIFLGVHQARVKQPATATEKWIGFAFMTALLFQYVARNSTDISKRGKFWSALALLAAVHMGLGIVILRHVYGVALIDFAAVGVPEYYALIRWVKWFSGPTIP